MPVPERLKKFDNFLTCPLATTYKQSLASKASTALKKAFYQTVTGSGLNVKQHRTTPPLTHYCIFVTQLQFGNTARKSPKRKHRDGRSMSQHLRSGFQQEKFRRCENKRQAMFKELARPAMHQEMRRQDPAIR